MTKNAINIMEENLDTVAGGEFFPYFPNPVDPFGRDRDRILEELRNHSKRLTS